MSGQDTPEVADLRIKAALGDHERECREHGPIAELRKEVSVLNGWAKVLAVLLALVPVWLAVGGWALTGYIRNQIDKAMHGGGQANTGSVLVPAAMAEETKRP